ncbi:hypothetical protein SPSIL_032280 [Sporomusa silvacetica DSM 10669]|uniref:Uncharacterized protein n=1 Tax=Sporomusa silvacetica DSM 10669 TaxID=1123289 RepID=A0ABZ3IN16_9FIRM|nr:multidrug resistance protein MdtB [Sporomusa silvacetica DSM 10669]
MRKVQLLGVQTEKIYIEIENSKLARLGLDPAAITAALQAQNAMAAAGMLETVSDNVYLRITGMFENLEDIRTTPIQADGRTFRLGDIAKVSRAYAEPADPKMFYNGQLAIGISLAMEPGGNILTLGKNLETTETGTAGRAGNQSNGQSTQSCGILHWRIYQIPGRSYCHRLDS